MRKRDELADPKSCLNRAADDELVFTLLGRDEDAPATIRDWVARRIQRGKNKPDDPQMRDAEATAAAMERERPQRFLASLPLGMVFNDIAGEAGAAGGEGG